MEIVLIILVLLLIVLNGAFFFTFLKSRKEENAAESQAAVMLNQNLQGMQERLDTVSKGLNERLDGAARAMGHVQKELGVMQEIGRNMQALQDFLKSPKLRGNIGEEVLRQMLDQYFPQHLYDMQYKFKEGQIVDAILKTDGGIIPIDSKFPMENYQRMVASEDEAERASHLKAFVKDVKKHVNDIAKKYILPDQGTVDFAVMYVPSESVYYEIIRNDIDLNLHGIEKKVLFVSPNSFYYFLRVLMMGMQEKKMAEAAKDIIAAVRGIQKDAERFGGTLGVLNTHISNAGSALDRVQSEYTKLAGKIERVDEIDESKLLD